MFAVGQERTRGSAYSSPNDCFQRERERGAEDNEGAVQRAEELVLRNGSQRPSLESSSEARVDDEENEEDESEEEGKRTRAREGEREREIAHREQGREGRQREPRLPMSNAARRRMRKPGPIGP